MKIALFFLCALSAFGQTVGWTDMGSSTILKGSPFKAGLQGVLLDCPSGLRTYCNSYAGSFAFAGNEEKVVAAQSGCTVDTVHVHMYCTGGGHGDYYGNQVYDVDLVAKTITRMTDPSPPTAGQVGTDNNASSSHSQQGLVYLPNEDCLYKWGIGVSASPVVQTYGWWICNLRTSPTWTAKAPLPETFPFYATSGGTGCTNGLQTVTFTNGGGTGATGTIFVSSGVPSGYVTIIEHTGSGYTSTPTAGTVATCTGTVTFTGGLLSSGTLIDAGADPNDNCVIDTSSGTESMLCVPSEYYQLWRYTPSLDTGPGSSPWTSLNTVNSTEVTAGSTCRVQPIVKKLFCVGLNQAFGFSAGLYSTDLTSYVTTNITSSATGCSALWGVISPGWSYDGATGLMVGYIGTGNSLVLFDPVAGTCVTTSFPGGPTSQGTTALSGVYGKFDYIPSLNTFFVLNNATTDMFSVQLAPTGIGHSTYFCSDYDGDGYGAGPLVSISTTLSSSASTGASSIVVASVTGISTGTVLRLGLGSSMEIVQVSGVTGTTLSLLAALQFSHSSSAVVTDLNCLGTDADDNDPAVWTNAQVITKYTTIPAFLTQLGNYIIAENPFCGSITTGVCDNGLTMATAQAKANAAALGLSSPTATYYMAPATPGAGCTGTMAQCTGSDTGASSTHCAINTPCLTVTGLIAGGFTSGAGPGSLILLRDNYSGNITSYGGLSTKFTTWMSYPGEMSVFDISLVSGSKFALLGTASLSQNYVSLLNMRFQNGADISISTQDGVSPSACHDILISGNYLTNTGQIGNINGFNGLNNIVIERNVSSNNAYMHGIYIGSRQLPGTQVIVRQNLLYNNNYSNFHFNGQISYMEVDQNIVWGANNNNGLSLQNGVTNSFIRSNLSFGNNQGFGQFYNYEGVCGDASQGAAQYICPHDNNFNLVADNTDYTFSANQPSWEIANNSSGCVWTATTCPSPVLVGDLGNNTFKNNIFVDKGPSGASPYPPIVYDTCVSITSAYFTTGIGNTMYPGNTPCLFNTSDTYLPTSTFTNNLSYNNGAYHDTNVIAWGPPDNMGGHYTSHSQTLGNGWYSLTCSTAGMIATVSGCAVADPKFENASSTLTLPNQFNFQLTSSSPALNAGVAPGITYDLIGNVFPTTPSLGSLQNPGGAAVCGITPTSLPNGTVGVAYSQVLTNANCSASTWSITGGSLPAGLSGCNSGSGTTCTISGTPTGAGTSTFTANYSTAANPLSITIAAGVTVKGVSAGNGIMTGIQ